MRACLLRIVFWIVNGWSLFNCDDDDDHNDGLFCNNQDKRVKWKLHNMKE